MRRDVERPSGEFKSIPLMKTKLAWKAPKFKKENFFAAKTNENSAKMVKTDLGFFFPSDSFSMEEGFSHNAYGHIGIYMNRGKGEVNELAFCWSMVHLQTFLLTSVQAHRPPALDCQTEPALPERGLYSWNCPPTPKLTRTMSTHPHSCSFKGVAASA